MLIFWPPPIRFRLPFFGHEHRHTDGLMLSRHSNGQAFDQMLEIKRQLQAHPVVMVDVYADWCPSCRAMEAALSKPAYRLARQRLSWMRADMTVLDAAKQAWMQQLAVPGPPALLLMTKDAKGQPKVQASMLGYAGEEALLSFLIQAGKAG